MRTDYRRFMIKSADGSGEEKCSGFCGKELAGWQYGGGGAGAAATPWALHGQYKNTVFGERMIDCGCLFPAFVAGAPGRP